MGFISSIKELDTEIFLYLNSKHNSFFDFIMYWASNRFTWVPLYVLFAFLAYKYFGKRVWLVILSTLMLIILSDQISNNVFKKNFVRYRPSHNITLASKIHVNGDPGGAYGFVSSHAANTFAIAMFLGMLFRNKIRYFTFLIFLWAFFVSYSRIYNGVHYPADVACGGLLGMLIGYIVYRWYQLVDSRLDRADNEK